MRKLLLILAIMCALSSESYGAASEDMNVYVRQDVFDAKMEALFNKFHAEIENVRGDIKALSEKIDGVNASLSNKIDNKIDKVDTRVSDLRQDLYLGLVIIGLLAAYPAAKEFFKWREERKERIPSFTLEDVRRLIEENNVKLRGSSL